MKCVLAGNASLLIACGEVLVERGHSIEAVVSGERSVLDWASAGEARCFDSFDAFGRSAAADGFDLFFSIANLRRVPPEVLSRARRAAVNFHDGPLPAYAGLHATSWALVNGESEHGVTWHDMTDRIDAGDILKQRTVPIEPDDDAYALNMACYGAAIESFEELVDEFDRGEASRVAQSLERRTYFARDARPCTLIDWTQPAGRIVDLSRALRFGSQPNPLGVPKVRCAGTTALVPRIESDRGRSGAPPGTIVGIDRAGLRVATSTLDVLVREVRTFCGAPLEIDAFVERTRARVGDSMDVASARDLSAHHALQQKLAPHEIRWLRRLERLASFDHATGAPPATKADRRIVSVDWGEALGRRMLAAAPAVRLALLAAGAAIAAGRLDPGAPWIVGVSTRALSDRVASLPDGFCDCLPIVSKQGDSFASALEVCSEAAASSTFTWDMLYRYPVLHRLIERVGSAWVDAFVTDREDFLPRDGSWRAPVGIALDGSTLRLNVAVESEVASKADAKAEAIARLLPGVLDDLLDRDASGATNGAAAVT